MASPQISAARSFEAGERGASAAARRLVVALLVFVLVIALSILLPRSLPGEMSKGELTPHASAACRACPPTDQITAAGMAVAEDGVHLNISFAAPPLNTLLHIAFPEMPGEIELQQSGKSWRSVGRSSSGIPQPQAVAERDNQVVITFPETLRVAGVAVKTGSGDRLPETGFVTPTYPVLAHFNATDIILSIVLALTAWYGYTRGFSLEIADLIVLAGSLAITAVVYRPLAAAFAALTNSAAAGAIMGSALPVVIIALTGFWLTRRYFPRIGTTASPFDARASALLGGVTGCLRQLPVMAMLLVAGADLTVLHWASRSINSSLIGTALMHAWKSVFSVA